MLAAPPKVHVASAEIDSAAGLCRDLALRGFATKLQRLDAGSPGPMDERDILVIAGDFDALKRGGVSLPQLCQAVRERTIIFLAHLTPRDFADLARCGFGYINPVTTPTVDNLVFLIAEMDPEAVYHASKQQALLAERASAIETGVLSFFRQLRRSGFLVRPEEAERQRREMDDLLGMSPMSVWLDLFRNYHDATAQHCSLVSAFTLVFARTLGFGERDVGRLFDAAFFHDVGKAAVPLAILDKPGRLTADEWAVMRSHAERGHEILIRDARTAGGIARVARDHHEYLDGTGYPNRLTAAQIDDATRIVTICDIFAALVEKRPYKAPMAPPEAYAALLSMAGTKLDPDLLRAFEAVVADYDVRLPIGAFDPGGAVGTV